MTENKAPEQANHQEYPSFSSETLVLASAALFGASEVLRLSQIPSSELQTTYKPDATPATIADRESSKRIISLLRNHFGSAVTINDEEGFAENRQNPSEKVLYVDPLDGTRPFAEGLHTATIGIAYYKNGEPVSSVIVNPFQGEMVISEVGIGAFSIPLKESARGFAIDGQPQRLDISSVDNIHATTVAIDPLINEQTAMRKTRLIQQIPQLLGLETYGVHATGSNIDYQRLVAEGKLLFGFTDAVGGPWDVLAGRTIIEAAGGIMLDVATGQPANEHTLAAVYGNAEIVGRVFSAVHWIYNGYRGFAPSSLTEVRRQHRIETEMKLHLTPDRVFTHRGLEPSTPHFFPESSFEAFQNQLSRGFGIEFDPNFVKDGIVVSHDSTLNRITNGKDTRDFHDATVAEVTSLRYTTKNGDGTPTQEGRIPTFDELLELIDKSTSKINALHLKGKFQDTETLDRLVAAFTNYPQLLDRIVIFDAKPETARYLRGKLGTLAQGDQLEIHIAPSVAHPYDIERYNDAVKGTLISVEDAIRYREEGLYDWVWLDEWDLADKDGHKTLYNAEIFEKLKQAGYKISLVTPELHGTSPGLLGGEAHEDAATREQLFARIQDIIAFQPDAICTDYPNEVIEG